LTLFDIKCAWFKEEYLAFFNGHYFATYLNDELRAAAARRALSRFARRHFVAAFGDDPCRMHVARCGWFDASCIGCRAWT
jgi:hypothetical protein